MVGQCWYHRVATERQNKHTLLGVPNQPSGTYVWFCVGLCWWKLGHLSTDPARQQRTTEIFPTHPQIHTFFKFALPPHPVLPLPPPQLPLLPASLFPPLPWPLPPAEPLLPALTTPPSLGPLAAPWALPLLSWLAVLPPERSALLRLSNVLRSQDLSQVCKHQAKQQHTSVLRLQQRALGGGNRSE